VRIAIDQIVYQLLIYFITLFGISKILFFSPIVRVSTAGRKNVMELFGYTTSEWFLIADLLGVGSFWIVIWGDDDR